MDPVAFSPTAYGPGSGLGCDVGVGGFLRIVSNTRSPFAPDAESLEVRRCII